MRNRVLLAVLIGVSLILAVVFRANGASDQKRRQSLAFFESMSKPERERFNSNAIDFYQHHSKTAKEERKRLRTLYNQIQNDPECERLTKIMEQYVDWINRVGNPSKMREIQGQSIEERVETIKTAIQEETQQNTVGENITGERMRDRIREGLPSELRDFHFPEIFHEFDAWLTVKYAEEKSKLLTEQKLTVEQLNRLPKFEKMYADMFHSMNNGTSSEEGLGFPEKLAMVQFVRLLDNAPRNISGIGGGRRGGASSLVLREEFLDSLENDKPNLLEQIDDPDKRQLLAGMSRTNRTEVLQRLLALAILDQYPMLSTNVFRSPASERFSQSPLLDDQQTVEFLGDYLSVMTRARRDEILKMDPRFAGFRLHWELLGNADMSRFYDRFSGGSGGPGGGQGGPPQDSFREGRGPGNRAPGRPGEAGPDDGRPVPDDPDSWGRPPEREPRRAPPRREGPGT